MRLVVDANVVIAAIIRDSTTRRLLFAPSIEPYAPAYLFDELEEHKQEIAAKAGITEAEFYVFLRILRKAVTVLRQEDYSGHVEAAKVIMSDPDDVPFAAAAMALSSEGSCGIWSNDPHFSKAEAQLSKIGVSVLTTASLKELLRG